MDGGAAQALPENPDGIAQPALVALRLDRGDARPAARRLLLLLDHRSDAASDGPRDQANGDQFANHGVLLVGRTVRPRSPRSARGVPRANIWKFQEMTRAGGHAARAP